MDRGRKTISRHFEPFFFDEIGMNDDARTYADSNICGGERGHNESNKYKSQQLTTSRFRTTTSWRGTRHPSFDREACPPSQIRPPQGLVGHLY
jgi:hypothetical protein